MSWLDRLAERRILASQAQGALDSLQGAGQPLPDRPERAFVDAGDAVGYRIMAEAGVLPEEIALKKQVLALKEILARTADETERKRLMGEIARIETRRAIAVEARRAFMKP